MSKIILNEIVRIQEIMLGKLSSNMSTTQRYLFEAVVGGIDDVIEALVKSFDDKTDNLFRHSSDEGLESIISALKSKFPKNRIIRNIDNPKTLRLVYNELDGPAKEFMLKSIIKNSKGTMDNLLIDTIANKIGFTADDFATYTKSSPSAENLIKDLGAPEYLKGVITRYFNKINNVTDILSPTEINKFSKAVENKGVTWFSKDLINAYKLSTDEIISEIEKLNSEYLSKVSSNIFSEDEINKLVNAYSVAISRKLNMLEMKLNGGALKALDSLNLDNTITNKLKNGEGDIFKIFRNLQMQNPGGFWDNFNETNKSFIESITPKIVTKDFLGKKIPLPRFNMSSEFKQFLLTGQWAKFSDLYVEAVKLNAMGKSTMKIAGKTFKIPNIFKYILKIIYKSFIGSIVGAFMYSIANSLTIQLKIKKGINKTAKYIGLNEPFPNADKEYIQAASSIGGLIPQFLIQISDLLGNVEFITPIIGTFNKSFAANLLAYLTGSEEAGISVKGIMEVWNNTVNRVFSSDEEDEIEQSIRETPNPPSTTFTEDEKGLIEYLKSINKTYQTGSFRPKEDDYPSEGVSTDNIVYYYYPEENKWGEARY